MKGRIDVLASPLPGRLIVAAGSRLPWIDELRGVAVALMVLDHVLVQLDPGNFARYSITRLSLPLFMVCAAAVWRPATLRRWTVLAGVCVVEVGLGLVLGSALPGIVAVFVLVLIVVQVVGVERVGAVALMVGFLQALYLPVGWSGYEPGVVLGWFALGRLAGPQFAPLARFVPAGFASIGRRPLVWYVGHLVLLVPVAVLGA